MADTIGTVTLEYSVVVKAFDYGVAGSETPTLGGEMIVLRGVTKYGKATLVFNWEPWATVETFIALRTAGLPFQVSFAGYSGGAIFPSEGGISWSHVEGGDVPQDEVTDGSSVSPNPLDLWNGELNFILMDTD